MISGTNSDRGSIWAAEMFEGRSFISGRSQSPRDLWSQQTGREKGKKLLIIRLFFIYFKKYIYIVRSYAYACTVTIAGANLAPSMPAGLWVRPKSDAIALANAIPPRRWRAQSDRITVEIRSDCSCPNCPCHGSKSAESDHNWMTQIPLKFRDWLYCQSGSMLKRSAIDRHGVHRRGVHRRARIRIKLLYIYIYI